MKATLKTMSIVSVIDPQKPQLLTSPDIIS